MINGNGKILSNQHQNLCQEADCFGVRLSRQGLSPGCTPDGRTKPDLVDKVGQIVDQVERSVRDLAQQVTEVVTQRVDGPANRHNEAHEVEGVGHGWTQIAFGHLARLTKKDLKEDEGPATHAHRETLPSIDDHGLTEISEEEHHHRADQKAEEHARAEVGIDSLQDQEELNHLQRDCQTPINVSVNNWAGLQLNPVLAHVEVVNTCNQCDQSANVQRGLPVLANRHRLHQEENCRCYHGNGHNPERDCHMVSWIQETMQVRRDGCCRHGCQKTPGV